MASHRARTAPARNAGESNRHGRDRARKPVLKTGRATRPTHSRIVHFTPTKKNREPGRFAKLRGAGKDEERNLRLRNPLSKSSGAGRSV